MSRQYNLQKVARGIAYERDLFVLPVQSYSGPCVDSTISRMKRLPDTWAPRYAPMTRKALFADVQARPDCRPVLDMDRCGNPVFRVSSKQALKRVPVKKQQPCVVLGEPEDIRDIRSETLEEEALRKSKRSWHCSKHESHGKRGRKKRRVIKVDKKTLAQVSAHAYSVFFEDDRDFID